MWVVIITYCCVVGVERGGTEGERGNGNSERSGGGEQAKKLIGKGISRRWRRRWICLRRTRNVSRRAGGLLRAGMSFKILIEAASESLGSAFVGVGVRRTRGGGMMRLSKQVD